jgi:hypothetical protein
MLAGHPDSPHAASDRARQSSRAVARKGLDEAPAADAPQAVSDVLASPGQRLDASTRAFFEPRIGRDLSSVRVHTDAGAAASSRAIHARAYAHGNHIAFGQGQFAPESAAGRRLLAHELVHVLQASSSLVHRAEAEGQPDIETPIELPEAVSPETDALARRTADEIDWVVEEGWAAASEGDMQALGLVSRVEAILRDTFERRHSFDPQLAPGDAPVLQYYVAQQPRLRDRLAVLRRRVGADATPLIGQYLAIPIADTGRYTYQIFMAGIAGGELVEGAANYVTIRYLENGQPVWTRRYLFLAIGAGLGVAPVSISADWGWNPFTAAEYWEPADFGGGTMAVTGAAYAKGGPPHANGSEIEYATIYGDGNHIPIEADIGGTIWGSPDLGASIVTGILIPFWFGSAPGPSHGVLPPATARRVARDTLTVGFATGSFELDADAEADLATFTDRHREVLDGDTFTLTLIGHASRTGSAGLNRELSEARRISVQQAIEWRLGHGIEEQHLAGDAFGEQMAELEELPDTDDSARFRVVEIILVGKTTEGVP